MEVCGVRLSRSRVCGGSASELSLVAARQTVCVCRKSETLEAFQALEEGRVDRLDGKTPVPPSKGRLVWRQSSPSLPREVRLACMVGPYPNSPNWVAFPCHIFLYFCHMLLFHSPAPPSLYSQPSPCHGPGLSALKRQQPLHPLGAGGFSSIQAGSAHGNATAVCRII